MFPLTHSTVCYLFNETITTLLIFSLFKDIRTWATERLKVFLFNCKLKLKPLSYIDFSFTSSLFGIPDTPTVVWVEILLIIPKSFVNSINFLSFYILCFVFSYLIYNEKRTLKSISNQTTCSFKVFFLCITVRFLFTKYCVQSVLRTSKLNSTDGLRFCVGLSLPAYFLNTVEFNICLSVSMRRIHKQVVRRGRRPMTSSRIQRLNWRARRKRSASLGYK